MTSFRRMVQAGLFVSEILGLRRIVFAVDGVIARIQTGGAALVGQMQYGESHPLASIRVLASENRRAASVPFTSRRCQ